MAHPMLDGPQGAGYSAIEMPPLAQRLADRLDTWEPDVSHRVETLVTEIIELADTGALDLLRSRAVEQEVLDLLDEPPSW